LIYNVKLIYPKIGVLNLEIFNDIVLAVEAGLGRKLSYNVVTEEPVQGSGRKLSIAGI
jgi:hypothetical protein